MTTLDKNAERLVREALTRHEAKGGARVRLAIAGAPGSGKSTVAEAVAARINRARPGLADGWLSL